MKVTANVLLNYIRCRRFAALNDAENDIYRDEFDVASESHLNDFHQRFIDLFLDGPQDFNLNHVMTYDFHSEIELYETLDVVTDQNGEQVAFCLIPSTSKAFLKLKYSLDKHKYQLFTKNSFGAYEIKIPENASESTNYLDKIDKLTRRTEDIGRIVYKYAFKRFVYDAVYEEHPLKIYFVFLNSDYVYDGETYTKNLFHLFDFSFLYKEMKETIEADIYRMINHLELSDFTACPLVKRECRKGESYECKFVDFCFSHIPKENSILDYFNAHLGFDEPTDEGLVHHDTYELINEGHVDMIDVPISWLKDEKHLMQRYCIETDYTHIHQKKIEALLNTLKYPLIYLDFEALPCLLPRYFGEKPFTQSVFQYSIHIQEKGQKIDINDKRHYEFIAKPEMDCRRQLTESLIAIVGAYDSSVIVYHKTFEEQRLKELQEVFPEYRQDLQKIIDRLFDLRDVVKNNKKFYLKQGFSEDDAGRYNFYDKRLSGSYSLKKVIRIFNPTAYQNLNIKNGVEAYKAFMNLEYMAPTDRDKTIQDLLEYCKQDTYSMVEIIE
nr:DUF2779 domain-containing protein [Bacillota bacterium]